MKRSDIEKIVIEAKKYLIELKEKGDKDLESIVAEHGSDVSRVVDVLSESYIIDLLKSTAYNLKIISEESGLIEIGHNPDFTLLIDPLDGSSNFIHDIPWSSISIAVFDTRTQTNLTGAVIELFRNNLYSYDSEFSYINNKRVNSQNIKSKDDQFYFLYFNKDKIPYISKILNRKNIKIRSLGAASLDIIYVCIGKASLFMDLRNRLRNIDVAAALGFCKRIGITAVDTNGKEIRLNIDKIENIREIIITQDYSLISYLTYL